MTTTGTIDGHSYKVTYATENEWPVTSVRMSMRAALPDGVAVYPAGASPWSSGRIGSSVFATGDAEFDGAFTAKADLKGALRFLESREVRAALMAAINDHPGLWIGRDAVVMVERGHVRDGARLGALLKDAARVAMIVEGHGGAKDRQAAKPSKRSEADRAAAPRGARPEKPAAAAGDAGGAAAPVDRFVRACFDRAIAAYEVNRRIREEWVGRRIEGTGSVVTAWRLGGHDFDFEDLKGVKVELRIRGPEEIAPVVRVQIQVDDEQARLIEDVRSGDTVRFEGPVASANPLLHTIQITSAVVGR